MVPEVQPSLSSHVDPLLPGTPPKQLPDEQVSLTVQGLPSSQAFPSLPGTATQLFCASLQLAIMHAALTGSEHVLGTPVQAPALHASCTVQ
jgi:hypothetical protein